MTQLDLIYKPPKYYGNLTVDQEVGGSSPPSCTIANILL